MPWVCREYALTIPVALVVFVPLAEMLEGVLVGMPDCDAVYKILPCQK